MDTTLIIVLVLGLIFVVGGPIVGHLAAKATENAANEETNKTKTGK